MGHWHVWHNVTPSCSSPLSWWNFAKNWNSNPKKKWKWCDFWFFNFQNLKNSSKDHRIPTIGSSFIPHLWPNLAKYDRHVGYIIKLTKNKHCLLVSWSTITTHVHCEKTAMNSSQALSAALPIIWCKNERFSTIQ